jgi:glutaredoxin
MKITMYSKDFCPYCVRAKTFLTNRELPFEEIDLSGNWEEMNKMKEKWGWMTMPIIVINDGKWVGGYDDLKRLEDEGMLESTLRSK